MCKTLLNVVLASLCLFFSAAAQPISPLKVGDAIPEALWNMPLQVINHPQGKKTIKLKDYRDKKLIILDFWATWCSPCVASIDKLEPLYHQNSKNLMLLPIAAHDESEKAATFMNEKQWKIPSVYDGDKKLYTQVFPPPYGSGIPYMVWIKDNKVFAIPNLAYASEENIMKILKDEEVAIEMRPTNLKPLNYLAPLFVEGNGETGIYYRNQPYSVLAKYLPGYGTGDKTIFETKGDTTIIAAVNRTLPDLCFDAYQNLLFPGLTVKNGIIWKISPTLRDRLLNSPGYDKTHSLKHDLARKEWMSNNTYGYNFRYPKVVSEKQAFNFMQQDIAQFCEFYFGLKFKIAAEGKHRYAILRLLGTKQQAAALLTKPNGGGSSDKGRKRYNQVDYTQSFLNTIREVLPELTIDKILDSTGIEQDLRVNFDLPIDIKGNRELLIQELKRYGLSLEIKERLVPVLVITEEKAQPSKMIIE